MEDRLAPHPSRVLTTGPEAGERMAAAADELGLFFKARRARLSPALAGLEPHGASRRVVGLKREEVARMAGVSVDYYARLEQGRDLHVSDAVLEALARALQLDEVDRAHVADLTRTGTRDRTPLPPGRLPVDPSFARIMATQVGNPAFVVDPRYHVVAANPLALLLFDEFGSHDPTTRNFAHYVFLTPSTRDFYDDWPLIARVTGGWLRRQLSRHPDDPEMLQLVRQLCVEQSFADLWMGYELDDSAHNRKLYHHPLVGDMTLDCDNVYVPNNTDQSLTVLTAAPGTPSEVGLDRLRALAAEH